MTKQIGVDELVDVPNAEGLKLTRQSNVVYTSDTCDGCGRAFAPQEVKLTGIDSCCGGGCWRSLCKECVDAAHTALHMAS